MLLNISHHILKCYPKCYPEINKGLAKLDNQLISLEPVVCSPNLDRFDRLLAVTLGEAPQHRGLGLVGDRTPDANHADGAPEPLGDALSTQTSSTSRSQAVISIPFVCRTLITRNISTMQFVAVNSSVTLNHLGGPPFSLSRVHYPYLNL